MNIPSDSATFAGPDKDTETKLHKKAPELKNGEEIVKDKFIDLLQEDVADAMSPATNRETIWQQKSLGSGFITFGYFEFKLKKEKDGFVCQLTGISKLNILRSVKNFGYRKRYLKDSNTYLMTRVNDNIIEEVTPDIIRVETYEAMQLHGDITIDLGPDQTAATFSHDLLHTIYLKNQDQIFNKNFLELMLEFTTAELQDSKEKSYFLFLNAIVEVTKVGYTIIPYAQLSTIDRCVWKSHIMNRDFTPHSGSSNSVFEDFICNISNNDPGRVNAFRSAMGYLMHNYNGSHMGQAIMCYDEKPTDSKNPQGGTGKGLLAQAIANMRETAKIDGRHMKADDRFRFQTVKVTSQVVIIDDLGKEVPFEIFFSCLTDGWTIEKKNEDKIKLLPEDSPKMLFSMNTVISGNGPSHKRRMFILEFSDHYSRQIMRGTEHPIEDAHGVLFDRIKWTNDDWNAFTSYMINCLSYYLANDLQPYELINVGTNTLIQTTSEDFAEWVKEQCFEVGRLYKTKELFEEFKTRFYGIDGDYKQRTFTNNIGKFAAIQGWSFKVTTNSYTKLSEFEFNIKINS